MLVVAESVINAGERSQSRQPRSSNNVPSDVLPAQVPKVNVTTGRTANASHRRRKQDANFACTVPGCGSTFTRGFNLKGHLRSHFEEKPYKCHWPGCGKGFARQHDCDDMNSCIVILGRLNVKGVGNSLRGWMR